ncbi:hypothetical protein JOQ06_006486, partial [Pogonophryne albipinna]
DGELKRQLHDRRITALSDKQLWVDAERERGRQLSFSTPASSSPLRMLRVPLSTAPPRSPGPVSQLSAP